MIEYDKKAFLFYFLMSLILLDFGNQLRKISFIPYLNNYKNPIFEINHLNNSGCGFGILQDSAFILAVLGIIIILFITFYVIKFVKFKDKTLLLSLTLFSSGTLGNVIERIKFGYVIDYIKLNFIDFPTFNSFDIMICLGIFLYFIIILKREIYGRKIPDKQ